MSVRYDISLVEKEQYSRLEFVPGESADMSDFYTMYKIPTDEQMIVYADRGRGLSRRLDVEATIITDKAIYTHPRKQILTGENRIPLDELCRYIVYRDSKKVSVLSQDAEYSIYNMAMPGRESVGEELCTLLRQMQKTIMRLDVSEKRVYEDALRNALSIIRADLKKYGILDKRYISLLEIISKEQDFAAEAVMLLLENSYRRCDEAGYLNLLQSNKEVISEEKQLALQKSDEIFFESYINDISDVDRFIMSETMIEPYINLKKKSCYTKPQAAILAYLCVIMEDDKFFEELLSIIKDKIDDRLLWQIMSHLARSKNAKMRNVFSKILAGDDLLPNEITLTDDLGLCPMHYALLTRDKNIALRVLSMANWKNAVCPFPNDKIISTVYDFNLIAALLYEDEELIEEIFVRTDPQAEALRRSIKQMDVFIGINEQMEKKDPMNSSLYIQKKNEYLSMKSEIVNELKNLARDHARALFEKAAIIRDIKHPFASFVLELIDTPDGLFTRLASTMMGYRLLKYKDTFFVAAPGTDIGLPYYENAFYSDISGNKRNDFYEGDTFPNPEYIRAEKLRAQQEEERRRKKEEFYRNQEKMRKQIEKEEAEENPGWFSPIAHKDIQALKKEYRMLVKQYHPDSTGSKNSAITLRQIMIERAAILEQMQAI